VLAYPCCHEKETIKWVSVRTEKYRLKLKDVRKMNMRASEMITAVKGSSYTGRVRQLMLST